MKLSRIPAECLMLLLSVYKRTLSRLFPPACRYTPTCSEYAMEAVDRHGAIRGLALGLWRLMRCHPLTRGGYDPVPAHDAGATHRVFEASFRRTGKSPRPHTA